MEKRLLKHLENLLPAGIRSVRALSGGDISSVYALEAGSGKFLAKIHQGRQGYAMLQAEKRGLEVIAATGTVRVPRVFECGQWERDAFLLMEFIETKRPDPESLAQLGRQLAELHRITHPNFGFEADNFIGSLPQSNRQHSDWTAFYVQERLLPQFGMAQAKGLLDKRNVPDTTRMEEVCAALFQHVRPSLLHGDLWGGNYLIAASGEPCLIDPAVYYGHSEADLAMSRLFGGFGPAFYEAYYQIHPPKPGTAEREDLYQLYYLLVHLNLFGASYYDAVIRILRKYF